MKTPRGESEKGHQQMQDTILPSEQSPGSRHGRSPSGNYSWSGCTGADFRIVPGVVVMGVASLIAVLAATELPAAGPALPATENEVGADLARQPSWKIPSRPEVEARLWGWLDGHVEPEERRQAARVVWQGQSAEAPGDLLDALMAAITTADPRCQAIREVTVTGVPLVNGAPGQSDASGVDLSWLDDAATDPFQRGAVRLWLGRECVRLERYDEGLRMLDQLDVATAVDPAALLFNTAACRHWLLQSDSAVESLDRLQERSGEIPVRYERVARLLRADLTSLEDESLDHIARRMRDITRRLGLGRAGPVTRQVQDGVIESLDKLIAAIEEQQNQQSGGGGSPGAGNSGNGKPMDDSRLAGGQGAGDVTRKDLGDGDGWGNLPPHKREEALQQISREFPAHYREAIEQYFKRLATGESTP